MCSGVSMTHKDNSWLSALFGQRGREWGRNSVDNLVGKAWLSQLPSPCLLSTRQVDACVPWGRGCQSCSRAEGLS